jgi:tryptophan 2,3-dioxygenase
MLQRRESYENYLQLPTLLSIQRPRSSTADSTTWAAERFFILCHQVSELWLSQILLDLKFAAELIEAEDWDGVCTFLSRAASLTLLTTRALASLASGCPRDGFMRFRSSLKGMSAGESAQFREFLTLLNGSHASLRALQARLPDRDADASAMASRDSDSPQKIRAARALDVLLRGAAIWRALHIVVTKFFIVDLPGTGGSAGVRYLSERYVDAMAAARAAVGAAPADMRSQVTVEELESAPIETLVASLRLLEAELQRNLPGVGDPMMELAFQA